MNDEAKIYTRSGDDGTTSLGDATRASKTDSRIEAYSTVDETNSLIGLALSLLTQEPERVRQESLKATLEKLQHELFDLGADLARPLALEEDFNRATQEWVDELESSIDSFQKDLPELTSFIVPGGTPVASALHVARTAARRAERAAWAAIAEFGSDLPGGINSVAAQYLNRLSDLLFVMARAANHGKDVRWVKRTDR